MMLTLMILIACCSRNVFGTYGPWSNYDNQQFNYQYTYSNKDQVPFPAYHYEDDTPKTFSQYNIEHYEPHRSHIWNPFHYPQPQSYYQPFEQDSYIVHIPNQDFQEQHLSNNFVNIGNTYNTEENPHLMDRLFRPDVNSNNYVYPSHDHEAYGSRPFLNKDDCIKHRTEETHFKKHYTHNYHYTKQNLPSSAPARNVFYTPQVYLPQTPTKAVPNYRLRSHTSSQLGSVDNNDRSIYATAHQGSRQVHNQGSATTRYVGKLVPNVNIPISPYPKYNYQHRENVGLPQRQYGGVNVIFREHPSAINWKNTHTDSLYQKKPTWYVGGSTNGAKTMVTQKYNNRPGTVFNSGHVAMDIRPISTNDFEGRSILNTDTPSNVAIAIPIQNHGNPDGTIFNNEHVAVHQKSIRKDYGLEGKQISQVDDSADETNTKLTPNGGTVDDHEVTAEKNTSTKDEFKDSQASNSHNSTNEIDTSLTQNSHNPGMTIISNEEVEIMEIGTDEVSEEDEISNGGNSPIETNTMPAKTNENAGESTSNTSIDDESDVNQFSNINNATNETDTTQAQNREKPSVTISNNEDEGSDETKTNTDDGFEGQQTLNVDKSANVTTESPNQEHENRSGEIDNNHTPTDSNNNVTSINIQDTKTSSIDKTSNVTDSTPPKAEDKQINKKCEINGKIVENCLKDKVGDEASLDKQLAADLEVSLLDPQLVFENDTVATKPGERATLPPVFWRFGGST